MTDVAPMTGDSNPEGLDWIELADFTPGIFEDHYAAASSAVDTHTRLIDGAATIENTVGCYADTSGALSPLPAANRLRSPFRPNPAEADDAHFGTFDRKANYILDGIPTHDVFTPGDYLGDNLTLMEYAYRPTGDPDLRIYAQMSKMSSTGAIDYLFVRNPSVSHLNGGIKSGQIEWTNSAPAAVADAAIAASDAIRIYAVLAQGSWPNGTAIAAAEKARTDFDTAMNGGAGNYPPNAGGGVWATPDPDVPGFATINDVQFTLSPDYIVAHQGRIVGFVKDYLARNVAYLIYTKPLKATDGGIRSLNTAEEDPTGIGVAASMTGDELLIVKLAGGGLLIRGDINNPQVVRVPGIEPTHGVVSKGVHTPLGFAYGSKTGVYIYSGGGASESISAGKLDGFFWKHESESVPAGVSGYDNGFYQGNRGRFGYWSPFLCVPNNYLFNVETQGWWRLEEPGLATGPDDPPPYNIYRTTLRGNMFAWHYKLTAQSDAVLASYDWDTLRSHYTWQSQPLIRTRRDNLLFRQIELVATASAESTSPTVTVTLTGFDSNGEPLAPVQTVLALTANGRVSYRLTDILNFQARYVQVRIEADAATGPAPKVHAVRCGTVAGNAVAKG